MYTRIAVVAFCFILKSSPSGGYPQVETDKTSLVVSSTERGFSNQIKENDVDDEDYEDINEVPAFDVSHITILSFWITLIFGFFY